MQECKASGTMPEILIGADSRSHQTHWQCNDNQCCLGQPQCTRADIIQGNVINTTVHIQARNHDNDCRNGQRNSRETDFFLDNRGNTSRAECSDKGSCTDWHMGKVNQFQPQCIGEHSDESRCKRHFSGAVEHQRESVDPTEAGNQPETKQRPFLQLQGFKVCRLELTDDSRCPASHGCR